MQEGEVDRMSMCLQEKLQFWREEWAERQRAVKVARMRVRMGAIEVSQAQLYELFRRMIPVPKGAG